MARLPEEPLVSADLPSVVSNAVVVVGLGSGRPRVGRFSLTPWICCMSHVHMSLQMRRRPERWLDSAAEWLDTGMCRCNRESRHRGVCNARAAAPGFTPAQEDTVTTDDLPKEELGSVDEEPSEGHNDSEQGTCSSH